MKIVNENDIDILSESFASELHVENFDNNLKQVIDDFVNFKNGRLLYKHKLQNIKTDSFYIILYDNDKCIKKFRISAHLSKLEDVVNDKCLRFFYDISKLLYEEPQYNKGDVEKLRHDFIYVDVFQGAKWNKIQTDWFRLFWHRFKRDIRY